ncbi:hypothetical protein DSO57_1026321 [Entomophthora muscae]|uniref:Uncharacterized protein n=1 Tax=Entomophthora muscae TaxID=34485 RepID=A0ACC2UBW6_9FUNG|nr:hypothetical protein DSO57_1026321 [Entomophthora muscae]
MYLVSPKVSVFSPNYISTVAPLGLEPGVIWTGPNQTDFGNYHTRLFENVTLAFQGLRKSKKHQTSTSILLNTITHFWLDPQPASEFVSCHPNQRCLSTPHHTESIHNTSLPTSKKVMELISLTDKIIPHKSRLETANLPANFKLNFTGPAIKYAWIRVLAWRIHGQFSHRHKTKAHITKHTFPFYSTVL